MDIIDLMPPPFSMTPFVLVASALKYPMKKLWAVIAANRFVRFLIEGSLAIIVGRQILRIARSPAVEYGVWALIVISLIG